MKNQKKNNIKAFFKQFAVLKNIFALIFFIVMVLYFISLIVPTAWLIISTFKDRIEFRLNRFGLPQVFTLENYKNVFSKLYVTLTSTTEGIKKIYMPELMFNALYFSFGTIFASLFIQSITAYACARYKTKIGSIIVSFVIISMILPLVGTVATTVMVYKKVGIYNSRIGMFIASGGFGGSTFLILLGAFKGIPNEYKDSAELDGASQLQVMFRIMFPMIKTTLLALAILNFIGLWNDYATPLIYLPKYPTIGYGLFQFRYSSDSLVSAIPMQLTASIVVMVPIFIIFMLFKNKIMGNLMLGGLKG